MTNGDGFEDARSRLERRLRAGWAGAPGPAMTLAAAAFGAGSQIRHFAYDAGILRTRRAPLPIISVGGLTVGGSGKTPVVAELGRWTLEAGHRLAILTRGYADELALHRELNPEAIVLGRPDRLRAAEEAARNGAEVAILDDGFQHRRLHRDLELVLVDHDAHTRTNGCRLPAGPFRERFGEVARADIVVVVRRDEGSAAVSRLLETLARRLPRATLASCRICSDALAPANPAAARIEEPRPVVALTAVMKPRLFFDRLDALCPEIATRIALPDHATPSAELVDRLREAADGGGLVGTRKDVVKLRDLLDDSIPLWSVDERLDWEAGRAAVEASLLAVLDRARRNGAPSP